ncbi:MAG: hypothetical protein ACI83O_000637 [Patescibacteria group bacterium]|jgi:hypothetical protein
MDREFTEEEKVILTFIGDSISVGSLHDVLTEKQDPILEELISSKVVFLKDDYYHITGGIDPDSMWSPIAETLWNADEYM